MTPSAQGMAGAPAVRATATGTGRGNPAPAAATAPVVRARDPQAGAAFGQNGSVPKRARELDDARAGPEAKRRRTDAGADAAQTAPHAPADGHLLDLPDEVLLQIVSRLGPVDELIAHSPHSSSAPASRDSDPKPHRPIRCRSRSGSPS